MTVPGANKILLHLISTSLMDLSQFPRRVYTPGPTPIEAMPSLSKELGGKVNLWVKRDDQLGLTGGGNKTRKLEFVIADAIANGADTIITCGAVQSNHCRLTLSACNKEKLDCHLIIEERVPGSYKEDASGNNYLFHLLGAKTIVPVGLGETGDAMTKLAEELKAAGKNVQIVPGGASDKIGALGYASCAAEIQHQVYTQPDSIPHFDALVTASGSGGTHAGIVAGMVGLRNERTELIGISTRQPKDVQEEHIYSLAEKTYKYALGDGDDVPALPREKVVVKDDYVGPGYSLPTEAMQEAVTLFARTEGILLDPVYTGKAAAGLIDLVRTGAFEEDSNVLFLHTGGAPSLYHYQPLN